jgi:hypothetical protein
LIVVLLDEADVFLEQRTLQDLQRNALVSGNDNRNYSSSPYTRTNPGLVFLRVLEYYDGANLRHANASHALIFLQGILILTSNRVGTFDEAFKSREYRITFVKIAQRLTANVLSPN